MMGMDYIQEYYAHYDEEHRLKTKSHYTEYLTTMRYIQKYLSSGARILEIGAGTGMYSIALAKQGYTVDAVELVPHNIEIMKRKLTKNCNITIYEGNAINLSFLNSNTYDIVLLLGPMYHLFSETDKSHAIREAIRVAKPYGVIFASYCNNDTTMYTLFANRQISDYFEKKYITSDFHAKSVPHLVFGLYRKKDIDRIMEPLQIKRLHFVGTDMLSYYFKESIDAFSDAEFDLYMQFQYQMCEREDCVGLSFHLLDVFQKLERISA